MRSLCLRLSIVFVISFCIFGCANNCIDNKHDALLDISNKIVVNDATYEAETSINILNELDKGNYLVARELLEVGLDVSVMRLKSYYDNPQFGNKNDIALAMIAIKEYRELHPRSDVTLPSYGEYEEDIQKWKEKARAILSDIKLSNKSQERTE